MFVIYLFCYSLYLNLRFISFYIFLTFRHPELQICFLGLLVRFQEYAPQLRAQDFESRDCWVALLSPAFTDLVILDFEYEISRRFHQVNGTATQRESDALGKNDSVTDQDGRQGL